MYRITMNRTSLRIRLSAAIMDLHGAQASWITSTNVHEKVKGAGSWQGDVETFELIRHPKAKYCYAWTNDVEGGSEIMMALKVPPVDSPQTAVREFLASRKRPAARK